MQKLEDLDIFGRFFSKKEAIVEKILPQSFFLKNLMRRQSL